MRNYSYKIKLEVIYTEIADYLSHSISPYTCCGVNYGLNKIRHKTLACYTTRVWHTSSCPGEVQIETVNTPSRL